MLETQLTNIHMSQIVNKKISKLKFKIYIDGNGNDFMENLFDHGILL
jgi:hypothetical protein